MKGKLIVIEGLDGSGKATQTKLLYEKLNINGVNVKQITFPDYASNSSALVKMYLAGEFGSDPSDVNAYAASAFYAVDRYASYKKEWGDFYNNGGVITADRYTTSNAIHQCSKLPENKWDDFLKWLFDFEYDLLGIPAPDIVIYLKVGIDTSQSLITQRYANTGEKKDIHEANREYLNCSAYAADYCTQNLGWKTILCEKNGVMRTINDIHQEIRSLVLQYIEKS